MTITQRLLQGDVPQDDVTPGDLPELLALRRRRLVVLYTGPGPAWWRITRRGRVELTEERPARPEPMF